MDIKPLYLVCATIAVASALVVELPAYVITQFGSRDSLTVQGIGGEQVKNVQRERFSFTINAVGDVMLSRNVEKVMIQEGDWRYPFREAAVILESADITFANLEGPVIEGRKIKTNEVVFRADPRALEGLTFAGVDVVSLANNHILDFGTNGLRKTTEYLEKRGILAVGAGVDKSEAIEEKCQVVEKIEASQRENKTRSGARKILNTKSVQFKVCFLAFNDSDVVPDSLFARDNHRGTARMDSVNIREIIQKVQLRSQPDIVIVSMHSGTEYKKEPNARQIEFAHAAIDAGADMVIGHHPHVLQPKELYKGKWILYSLGNFVFDQMFSLDTRLSAIARIEFFENTTTVDFIPVKIYNYAQPRIIEKGTQDYQEVVNRLSERL